jgi:hypothetical protein
MSNNSFAVPTAALANGRFERTLQVCAVVAALFFLTTGLIYLILGRWPVTHQDFWRIYDVCLHRSWLASSLLKYNGHSHFFPSQLWLADLKFLNGRQDFLFWTGLFFQCSATILLLIPIWRDQTVSFFTKLLSFMALTVLTFWMGRASMTASGAFNCCYSLTLSGAALSYCAIGRAQNRGTTNLALIFAAIAGGFLSSFSFGTGLATWPTLLITGYALRLPGKLLLTLAAAGCAAAAIFCFLPSREAGASILAANHWFEPSALVRLAVYYFHMIGSPLMQMGSAWNHGATLAPGPSSILATALGAAGSATAGLIIFFKVTKRNLRYGLESTAFALMCFCLVVYCLIALARADHIREIPSELDAPRYYYWSTLFWAGLIIVGLGMIDPFPLFRKVSACAVLALPVLAFPSHYREGAHWRFVRLISMEAATSLVDGVQDPELIKILSPFPKAVFRLSDEMRARKLDVFAPGYQFWINRSASEVFGVNRHRAGLKGRCRTQLLATEPTGFRVHGSVTQKNTGTLELLVILDSRQVVQGIARGSRTPPWMNRVLYGGIFPANKFVGFVRTYHPRESYLLHGVGNGTLSEETIKLPPPTRR